jgi:hypothetical protein
MFRIGTKMAIHRHAREPVFAPFASQQFREAAANEIATMVADLISKEYFIGKSIEQVELKLGTSTGGYYNSDANRRYIVHIDDGFTHQYFQMSPHE